MSRLTLIVAATRLNGIGKHGSLPWRLPKEMAYFARVTSNAPEGCTNAVIMGRTTWESIPVKFRPLKSRLNIVVSRTQNYDPGSAGENVLVCADVTDAANREHTYRNFLIGGASLYNDCLALPASSSAFVDRILLTRIADPAFEECDVFIDDFQGRGGWVKAKHEQLREWVGWDVPEGEQEEKGVRYEFQMWLRTETE